MNNSIFKLCTIILLMIGVTSCSSITNKMLPRAINKQMDNRLKSFDLLKDKDNITVVTVGTGTPFALDRSMTGTAIFVNGHFFMFDAGPGVVAQIELQNLPIIALEGVFITHYHSDHYMDLPNLLNRSWSQGNTNVLNIYGPDGLPGVVNGLNQFLAIESHYRVAHHGESFLKFDNSIAIANEFQLNEDKKKVVYNQDGIQITAFKVNHDPVHSAVGYAIEYKGKKVVISGDTKKNSLVQEMAIGADVLIHEVMLMSFIQQMETIAAQRGDKRAVQTFQDIQEYHTSPSEVAEIAQKAGVKKLILHHMAPTPDNRIIKKMYKDQMKTYSGELIFSEDGNKFIIK